MLPFPSGALLLAPMVGITNRAFRRLVAELGAPDYSFTEMASAEGYVSGAPLEAVYLDPAPDPGRTSVQFYAKTPERLAEACRMLAGESGSMLPRGVDINFGCSAPKIRRSGGGSAWSADPEGSALMVRAARLAWPGVLSAKLRSGPDGDYARLLETCRGLAEAGLDFLTLHPRSDTQKFRRSARSDLIGRLAADLDLPIVGNGDIRSPADAQAMFAGQRPAAVMVGREAVRRPWFFALARGAAADPAFELRTDLEGTALRFLDLADEFLPAEWRCESARRFFAHFAENASFAHHLKWELVNAPDPEAMRAVLASYFREVPADRILVSTAGGVRRAGA